MFVATLIADGGLDDALLADMAHQFDMDCVAGKVLSADLTDPGRAADLVFQPSSDFSISDCALLADSIREMAGSIAKSGFGCDLSLDVIVQPNSTREKRLIVADMDSTMITVECIDELADYAGIKAQIAEVTEAAMRGELDFAEALDARVALLKGLGADAIDRCLAERVRLMPGARTLVQTMRARGATAILVSGGFTRFAQPVGAQIGFDRVIANELLIEDDALTGAVTKPIVDSSTKEVTLLGAMAELGLDASATMAVGDGANDLAMIRQAGLGVAYHAKPVVAAAAGARIDHGDLTALLYAQGIARSEWVEG
ncbi:MULTISPECIES: phosphoserine phosphatase SerB [unclassified Sphingomonas]|uniref:phosphoserine phosphatase SerB n=1 Tax=unclassified Sphingomonas TaxID=196159 RepID=UPI002151D8CA|nr:MULTISPECIES: phosphoserine phosphatase SerB [unclassified Sphingomonas]MCR5872013.1 phosphoserine phosphatase SerB [Sphingomonas sp. J344]UUX99714.1 phosphoserine phosphatase SerB [Sphingomonas sp. J315]